MPHLTTQNPSTSIDVGDRDRTGSAPAAHQNHQTTATIHRPRRGTRSPGGRAVNALTEEREAEDQQTAVGALDVGILPDGVPTATDSDFWAHARCNVGDGRLTRLFFSDELQDIARAKHICATCPALIPCLEGALARREPWGVWGGQLFLNGRILAGKRRRGRPPKNPRAEDQLPTIPIPEQLQSVAEVRIA